MTNKKFLEPIDTQDDQKELLLKEILEDLDENTLEMNYISLNEISFE
ncbi:hypothetical protein [Legionella sp. W05-934-2]